MSTIHDKLFANQAGTVKMSGRINRHRRSHDIDIKPCTDYHFKVIASEDWNGMREDFKMASDTITFRVDYAPRVRQPGDINCLLHPHLLI